MITKAYVNQEGQLFIETTLSKTYSVYPSIAHYNERRCSPDFIDRDDVNVTDFKPINLSMETLTIN